MVKRFETRSPYKQENELVEKYKKLPKTNIIAFIIREEKYLTIQSQLYCLNPIKKNKKNYHVITEPK